jgi:hypothetical protein
MYHMLDSWGLLCDHEYLKILMKRGSPMMEYGWAIHKTLTTRLNQKKCSILSLIVFLFYRSHGIVGRSVCRIYNRGGALDWVTWSYYSEGSWNFAFLVSYVLVVIWFLSTWRFSSCLSSWEAHVHRKRISYAFIAFLILVVLLVCLL